jgi:hypothetical protein
MLETIVPDGPQFLRFSRGRQFDADQPIDVDFVLSVSALHAGATLIITVGAGAGGRHGASPGYVAKFVVSRAPTVQVMPARLVYERRNISASWETLGVPGQTSPYHIPDKLMSPELHNHHVFGLVMRSKKGV